LDVARKIFLTSEVVVEVYPTFGGDVAMKVL
jgi:hypothetical protein